MARLLSPDGAAAWAERLFLTPPRPRAAAASALDLIDARAFGFEHRGRRLAAWQWGDPERPAVLLAHGWGGHAAQMRGFAFPLVQAGLRVVAYDQPAHGVSEGRLTGLPDFAAALAALAREAGPVAGVIGHSLGAAGAALAQASGEVSFDRLVLVSPPADLVGHSRQFARWHWMSERMRRAMQAAIEERFGVPWDALEVHRLAPRLRAPALVIHDRTDRVVPWSQGERVAAAWPGAKLMSTSGLGHGRILQDDVVTQAAARFLAAPRGERTP